MGLFEKAQEEQTQNSDGAKICAHVRSKVEEIRSSASRIANESIWMTNIAYLCGVDGVYYNSQTRQYQPVNRASAYTKRNRIHVNKILPTIQNRLAKLCKVPPKYDVRPESNTTEDKDAARLSLDVLTYKWDELCLNQKRIFLYMWTQQCGHAYMKIVWDETLGRRIEDPSNGEFMHEGDIRADVVSPFEIFPNPQAKTFEDVMSSWIIQAKVRPLDYFRRHYPENGDQVKEESAWLMSAQYEQRIQSMNTRGPAAGSDQSIKNSAIELIKYEAPSKDYPNGRMIICANGVLLADKELPCGEIPFAKFDDVIVAGKYYSESIITHLRPIQDQYNEVVRKRAEWTKKLLAGKYAVARGSGISQEAMNDQSGEVLYYDPVPNAPDGGRPMAIQVPNIPQYAYNEDAELDKMFNDISGISEVSRGTLPSASIPAIGMQLLVESDDSRVGIVTEGYEHSWARVGKLILEYVQKYYILPRKIKLAGKNATYSIKEFTGEDLKGNTDVIVIRGSTLPGSKTLRRQEILNAYTQGLLGDPSDPKVREKVLSMVEFGDVGEMYQDLSLDMAQIKRGIDTIMQGQPVLVNEFDNHNMWIQELNRLRKSDKWDTLGELIQGLILSTMEKHVQAIMQISNAVPEDPMLMAAKEGAPMMPPQDAGVPPEAQAMPPPQI